MQKVCKRIFICCVVLCLVYGVLNEKRYDERKLDKRKKNRMKCVISMKLATHLHYVQMIMKYESVGTNNYIQITVLV
jgi:hypothetical protein